MVKDVDRWRDRYRRPGFVHEMRPVGFLYENREMLPHDGLALDVAAGEGRNALFLAELGLQVIALDISIDALAKCRELAASRRVAVHAAAVDLTAFPIPPSHFDVIMNFYYLQRDLVRPLVRALKPGGLIIFETLTVEQLKYRPGFNPEYLLHPGELLRTFADLQLVKYREVTIESDENKRAIAGIIARRTT